MVTFESVNIKDFDWRTVDGFGDVNVFQTRPWIDFLVKTQKVEPILIAVACDRRTVGYFFSLKVSKFGLKVLGSPFRGWATYFMGFNLSPDVSRQDVLRALPGYAFKELGCHYIEIVDPYLRREELEGLPFRVEPLPWFVIDLTKSEIELMANMKHTGRNCIRKAIKSGVVIEEAADLGFADDYYAQYADILKKKSLEPTYSLATLREMIDHLLPSGNLLLLRARNREGICIATGIFLAQNKTGIFWGAASWRDFQSLRPNELLAWHGMQNLKARGIQELHFGGECEQYKEKLGCEDANIFRIMKARTPILDRLINYVVSQKSPRFRNWALRRL